MMRIGQDVSAEIPDMTWFSKRCECRYHSRVEVLFVISSWVVPRLRQIVPVAKAAGTIFCLLERNYEERKS